MKKPEELGLTYKEWCVILDVMNAHLWTDGLPTELEVRMNVEDGISINHVDHKHGTSGDVLLTKLGALPTEDWETIRAVIEGFWELSDDPNNAWVPGQPKNP